MVYDNDNTSPFCKKCGKPFIYIGDVLEGQEPPYCTCEKNIFVNIDSFKPNGRFLWELADRVSKLEEKVRRLEEKKLKGV